MAWRDAVPRRGPSGKPCQPSVDADNQARPPKILQDPRPCKFIYKPGRHGGTGSPHATRRVQTRHRAAMDDHRRVVANRFWLGNAASMGRCREETPFFTSAKAGAAAVCVKPTRATKRRLEAPNGGLTISRPAGCRLDALSTFHVRRRTLQSVGIRQSKWDVGSAVATRWVSRRCNAPRRESRPAAVFARRRRPCCPSRASCPTRC